jgi:hypothetical protein
MSSCARSTQTERSNVRCDAGLDLVAVELPYEVRVAVLGEDGGRRGREREGASDHLVRHHVKGQNAGREHDARFRKVSRFPPASTTSSMRVVSFGIVQGAAAAVVLEDREKAFVERAVHAHVHGVDVRHPCLPDRGPRSEATCAPRSRTSTCTRRGERRRAGDTRSTSARIAAADRGKPWLSLFGSVRKVVVSR